MNLSPLTVSPDDPDIRAGVRRVLLPEGVEFRVVLPAGAQATLPDDAPEDDVPTGVWQWWASLLGQLQSGNFGPLRLVVQPPRRLGFRRTRVIGAEETVLREWVVREAGVPSSTGVFTMAWGVTGEAGRPACRGAAFSVADHLGLCLFALPDDLARLRNWWEPGGDGLF